MLLLPIAARGPRQNGFVFVRGTYRAGKIVRGRRAELAAPALSPEPVRLPLVPLARGSPPRRLLGSACCLASRRAGVRCRDVRCPGLAAAAAAHKPVLPLTARVL